MKPGPAFKKGSLFAYRARSAIRRKIGIHFRRSYAQCGEDVIARTAFDMLRIPRPSYADIGAHHPYHLSNTYLFYREGSRGVNVEPDPDLLRVIARARPRDINLNVGIGPVAGVLDLFIMSSQSLNTFSPREAAENESQGIRILDTRKVEVITINDLFEQYLSSAPDFLSLDAEGLDYEILCSMDPTRFRPLLICVETIIYATTGEGRKREEIDCLMIERGYEKFADTYINTLYVEKERWKSR
jgi:FkbM family methyltransferase